MAGALLLAGALPAYAQRDADISDKLLVQRYCAGIVQQFRMPDGTRADCISDTHAIEVEKSGLWFQALGYALWTRDIAEAENPAALRPQSEQIHYRRKAGIVLVCLRPKEEGELCTEHYAHLRRVIEEYHLPVTIWDCNWNEHMTRSDCPVEDMPEPTLLQKVE